MLSPYLSSGDRTLTAAQAKSGAFAKEATNAAIRGKKISSADYRVRSNPTVASSRHSTGYHEATTTTDTAVFLSGRTIGSPRSTLPTNTSNTALSGYSGKTILEANVRPVLEAGDGARPDTARTILSVPGGTAAGHSGSGAYTGGQMAAHDFVRHQTMRMLNEPHMTSGIAGVASGAVMVMSMAPGRYAKTVKDAGKLKDVAARQTWEADRNAAKAKLAHYHATLSPAEQRTAMSLARSAMSDLQDPQRWLLPDVPHSPMRSPTGSPGAAIAGGGYRQPPPLSLPASAATSSSAAAASGSPTGSRSPMQQAPPARLSPLLAPLTPATAAAPTTAKRARTPDPVSPRSSSSSSSAATAAATAATNKRQRTQTPSSPRPASSSSPAAPAARANFSSTAMLQDLSGKFRAPRR